MQNNLDFKVIIPLLIFSICLGSCAESNLTKQINPAYKGIVFNDRTVAIVIVDTLVNSTDKNTNEFMEICYGSFENFFKEYFPGYLTKCSFAKSASFIYPDKKLFVDKVLYKNKRTWEFVPSPARGTRLKDLSNNVPGLLLILSGTTIRSFNAYVNTNSTSQGYMSQTSGYDGHISITGRMVLWDNVKGDVITCGAFRSYKYFPPAAEITKKDFEDCLKLLATDVINNSPLYDASRAFDRKNLQ